MSSAASLRYAAPVLALALVAGGAAQRPHFPFDQEVPFHEAQIVFPLEHWHNHASSIVELPNGDLFAVWFHGSGERTADDVRIEGARKRKAARTWTPRFTVADTPGYPDTNCTLLVDPSNRLWLLWPTILANEWHTALMKYRISSDYDHPGPPRWETSEVLHITPGKEFEEGVLRYVLRAEAALAADTTRTGEARERARAHLEGLRTHAVDKLYRRLGWMTRAHPFVLDGTRMIVPLYSDGFSFSLMAITDDWGKTWHASAPLPGGGNIQPSIARRRDGSLYTLMRDNGPAPKRLHQSESRDRGETWSDPTDTDLPNPGSGAEVITLRNGHWALISNDTERARNSLAVQISEDEGKSWRWKRHLEYDPPVPDAGSYHYPSLIQVRDGSLHASYSYHLNRKDVSNDPEGQPARKTIKHAHFNLAWVMQGDPRTRAANP